MERVLGAWSLSSYAAPPPGKPTLVLPRDHGHLCPWWGPGHEGTFTPKVALYQGNLTLNSK